MIDPWDTTNRLNTIGDLVRSIRRNERYTGINVAVAQVRSRFANIWKDSLRNGKPGGWLAGCSIAPGVEYWPGLELGRETCSKTTLIFSDRLLTPSSLPFSMLVPQRNRKIWNIEMSIMERGPPKLGGKRRAQHMPRTRSGIVVAFQLKSLSRTRGFAHPVRH